MSEEIITTNYDANAELAARNERTAKAINCATSIDLTTREGMAMAFNAGIAGDHKVEDCIGEQVNMIDYYVEAVDTVDERTGEPTKMPHVVIFGDNGETYEGFSVGLYSSVQRLDTMIKSQGFVLDAEHPLTIEFAVRKARLGKMHYFKIVA